MGEAEERPIISFQAFNWSNLLFVTLPNSLKLQFTVSPNTKSPSGNQEYITNPLNQDFINATGGVKINIDIDGDGDNFVVWHN